MILFLMILMSLPICAHSESIVNSSHSSNFSRPSNSANEKLYSSPHVARLVLRQVKYSQLNNWKENNASKTFNAFLQSCREILSRDGAAFYSPLSNYASPQQWKIVCEKAKKIHLINQKSSRLFFENNFKPYLVMDENNPFGLFTGYYLPLLKAIMGDANPNQQFHVPIYALPSDLIHIDQTQTQSPLQDKPVQSQLQIQAKTKNVYSGKPQVRQFKNNQLLPYPTRKEINQGAITQKTKVLVWADNAIDVYFAQVQGSALVELPNKKRLLIGYAGDNGHPYTAIGKILIKEGELRRENVSMQSIRQWLVNHPGKAQALFNQNDSYVFFKVLNESNPLGTEKVPLTSGYSLAVDNRYIPFGAPIWIETKIPNYSSFNSNSQKNFQRLLIAQDTGGAIKGIVRGDIYWGASNEAEFIAGKMNSAGKAWILLPK